MRTDVGRNSAGSPLRLNQYDRDEAHNAARARLAPMIAQAARVQFELPDA
mgnify:CR=1 FL=1